MNDICPFLFLQAPDYEEMIKIPMDLHMVKNKCSNNAYESYEDFFADVKLIFTNAHEYYEVSAVKNCQP